MSSEIVRGAGEAVPRNQSVLMNGAIIDGRYEVTLALGSGGMGEVYEVIHLALRKPFALKCLNEDALEDVRAAQRFLKEIRGLAAVHSEFVVAISDCGKLENGSPYFVMERLRGQDLRKLLIELDSLPPLRAIKLAIDACLGLQAVHEAGLVHRDLKPENLFMTYGEDDNERCKVLDFGVAKAVGAGSTKQHALLGTLKYMAPEQISDPAGVGPATDLYALGAILFECLSGRPPHVAETEPELMFKIMNTEPPLLSSLVPSLDPTLCNVVARALQRDPERRYGSAVALAGALASCLVAYSDESNSESTLNQERYAEPPKKRTWQPWLLGLAGGLLIGLGLGVQAAPSAVAPMVPPAASHRPLAAAVDAAGIPPAPVVAVSADAQPAPAPVAQPPPSRAALPLRSKSLQPPARSVRPTLPAIDDQNPYQ